MMLIIFLPILLAFMSKFRVPLFKPNSDIDKTDYQKIFFYNKSKLTWELIPNGLH